MARTILDKELQELSEQILKLGALVDDALGKALEALETGDLAKSGMVIEADAMIDSQRAAVEEHTIRLLTLQQPLGGRDLRFLTSALSIAGDLERAGDGAAGIAQIILRMSPRELFRPCKAMPAPYSALPTCSGSRISWSAWAITAPTCASALCSSSKAK